MSERRETPTLSFTPAPSTESPRLPSSRTIPKDLGAFRTLVAGWEQVGQRGHSPVHELIVSPNSPSNINSEKSGSMSLLYSLPSPSNKTALLKEQFFRDIAPPPQQTSVAKTPTTPTYGGSGYRFAGVERLAQRQQIYEPPQSLSETRNEAVPVTSDVIIILSPLIVGISRYSLD